MDRLSGAGWLGLHVVVAVCVLTFVPLGLAALDRAPRLRRWWPAVAVPAAGALALPRGAGAGLLCVPYLVGCLLVPVALRRDRLAAVAAACLPVAAAGLIAERLGYPLLGYPLGVLGLTAAHFHVAGFGALLLVSLVPDRVPRLAAPIGVALVGAGFLVGRTGLGERAGDAVELAGAGVLSAGLWLALAGLARSAGARVLLGLSVLTLGLALLYAAGQLFGLPHLNLTWMVLTHGVLNAAAVLAALLAARRRTWSEHSWTHPIGTGRDRFEAASAALLGWEMHRRSGARVAPETPPAAVGQRMLSELGAGPFRVPEPCEVIDVEREPGRTVMHYRALPGHTFEGDERFAVLLGPDDSVRFEVNVRSKPALLIAHLGGPLVPVVQWLFIARCAHALRRALS